jgi:hypothetical protein
MATSLRDTIHRLATAFAAGVLDAIRRSSLEEILAETGEPSRRRREPRRRAETDFAAPARPASRESGGRLGRRSAGALEEVVDSIVHLLSRHPGGLRSEQIRSELGLSAKELPRPIAKALDAGRIRKAGQKRATTYFAATGGAGTGAGAGAKKKGLARGGHRRAESRDASNDPSNGREEAPNGG